MNKVVAIIQARMGSTRLPGKVMKKLVDKSVLAHVINRVEQSKLIDEIVIATTELERDEVIVKEAKKLGVNYYRGSEENVLSRFYYSAQENNADTIIRITSDCPLIDPYIIDELVRFYQENDYDLVTNAGSDLSQRTYPRGLDVEVFSFELLKTAFNNALKDYQLEHVTPYIYENKDKIYYYKNDSDYSQYRLTLDEEADWKLIKKIYKKLYKGEHNFYLNDIIRVLEKESDLKDINQNIEQKKIK